MIVRWTALAAEHLEAVHQYLAAEDAETADRLIERILAGVEMLVPYPDLGRKGRLSGTRELVITGTPYLVSYRVHRDEVQILAVLHGARRWPERF